MKKFLYTLCFTMVSSWGLLSCLGDSTTQEVTVNDEMAITYMKILAVNRYIHTISKSGNDSVYKATITSSSALPAFTIDHENKRIFNTDSLPYDTDLSRVVIQLSASTYTNTLYVKSLVGDTLFFYSNTDSIDFRTPREIRAYNYGQDKYRAYTVSINKHQVETKSIIWELMSPDTKFPEDETRKHWEQAVEFAGLDKFIGYGTKEGYAYDEEGKIMVSSDEGVTWEHDSLGDDPSILPTNVFSFTSFEQATNEETDYQLLVGTISEEDSLCTVWRKIAEYAERRIPSKWVNIEMEYYNKYALPAMTDLHLVTFHGTVLAIGSAESIYTTRDGGITWKVYDKFKFPDDYTYPTSVEVFVDDDDYLWLKDNDLNIIWRGVLVED